MSGTRAQRALHWYRLLYAACIVLLSVETMWHAKSHTDHRFWLPPIEVLGAALLAIRKTQRPGVIILLAVYAFAVIHTLHDGGAPTGLVLFAGTAIFIVVCDSALSGSGST